MVDFRNEILISIPFLKVLLYFDTICLCIFTRFLIHNSFGNIVKVFKKKGASYSSELVNIDVKYQNRFFSFQISCVFRWIFEGEIIKGLYFRSSKGVKFIKRHFYDKLHVLIVGYIFFYRFEQTLRGIKQSNRSLGDFILLMNVRDFWGNAVNTKAFHYNGIPDNWMRLER